MFVSAALAVDIGGTLSQAAVVARELGLPCVVNTRVGSRAPVTGCGGTVPRAPSRCWTGQLSARDSAGPSGAA